jgi:hypothetical protein
MFNVRGVYGALGVMLSLIALYLILEKSLGAGRIISAGGKFLVDLFRTLQGR